MSISLGPTTIGSMYLGPTKIGSAYLGSTKVYSSAPPAPNYNPLNLPANTIRIQFSQYTVPTGNATQVSSNPNVWDITINSTNWNMKFYSDSTVEAVLGANTSSVTNMSELFSYCRNLTSVALFDTSAVTLANSMFNNCNALTSIPLFPTDSMTNMSSMFSNCWAVSSGALALYQQASTQATPPQYYGSCFNSCGSDTTSGQAELAQIPASWGGTGA